MSAVASVFRRTITKKQIIGVTGILLSLFVLSHMLGNLLIFVGPKAYNEYSHALVSNPLIYLAEAGLLAAFLVHLGAATRVSFDNWRARTRRYAVRSNGEKGTSIVSRTLWSQGSIILVFVIIHLQTFKFGTHYEADYGNGAIRDLHRLVLEVFQSPNYAAWYVFALAILGFHLAHGIHSSLQSFGVYHPRYERFKFCASVLYSLIVAGGFISLPIYVFFFHKG